ncbi:hypothetical protein [Hansschlegelia sp.]|uniref:hypothetical protein n=1 Tax=Hansschlegelia sp. TaxID=2041892 RepID=UPI002C719F9C|nr:hypothetical protein [Hansschlegelia sp.]HVI28933.1 hypothetical protein [Hansschlegelia sp.]
MSDTTQGASGATGARASSVEADLETLRKDVATLTETLSTLVSDSAATARSAAREGMNRASAAADDARARAQAAADDLSATIVENPLTAVLVALGLGYVVGALGRSRH